jgi:GT2 family glycosyltransferase
MASQFVGRLRIIHESEPGLGRARMAGLVEAVGEITAFLDDDTLPAADWLEIIHQEFTSDLELQAISGRVELFNPADLPITIRLGTQRVRLEQVSQAFNLFVGCNMVARTQLVRRIGGFDPDFGAGGPFLSAEDADFFYRCWRQGAKVVYVPELVVYHDHGRRRWEEKRKLARGYIIGRGAFFAKHFRDIEVMKQIYWETRSAISSNLRGESEWGWMHLFWLYRGCISYCTHRAGSALMSSGTSRRRIATAPERTRERAA